MPMNTYVALLRAVTVGGTGKLPMADVRQLCVASGFSEVRTYIASGNVVLQSERSAQQVKTTLEAALAVRAGKPVAVLVRTAGEMAAIANANPFPDAAPNRVVAIFLDASPPSDTVAKATHVAGEEIVLGKREIYVHYGSGMADSKLVIPAARAGTARNLNTVTRLAQMAGGAH